MTSPHPPVPTESRVAVLITATLSAFEPDDEDDDLDGHAAHEAFMAERNRRSPALSEPARTRRPREAARLAAALAAFGGYVRLAPRLRKLLSYLDDEHFGGSDADVLEGFLADALLNARVTQARLDALARSPRARVRRAVLTASDDVTRLERGLEDPAPLVRAEARRRLALVTGREVPAWVGLFPTEDSVAPEVVAALTTGRWTDAESKAFAAAVAALPDALAVAALPRLVPIGWLREEARTCIFARLLRVEDALAEDAMAAVVSFMARLADERLSEYHMLKDPAPLLAQASPAVRRALVKAVSPWLAASPPVHRLHDTDRASLAAMLVGPAWPSGDVAGLAALLTFTAHHIPEPGQGRCGGPRRLVDILIARPDLEAELRQVVAPWEAASWPPPYHRLRPPIERFVWDGLAPAERRRRALADIDSPVREARDQAAAELVGKAYDETTDGPLAARALNLLGRSLSFGTRATLQRVALPAMRGALGRGELGAEEAWAMMHFLGDLHGTTVDINELGPQRELRWYAPAPPPPELTERISEAEVVAARAARRAALAAGPGLVAGLSSDPPSEAIDDLVHHVVWGIQSGELDPEDREFLLLVAEHSPVATGHSARAAHVLAALAPLADAEVERTVKRVGDRIAAQGEDSHDDLGLLRRALRTRAERRGEARS